MEKEKQIEMYLLKQAKFMVKWMKWLLYLRLAEIMLSILVNVKILPMSKPVHMVLTILINCVPIVYCIIFLICRKTEEHFKWAFLEVIILICDILGKLTEPFSTATYLLDIAVTVLNIIWMYHRHWGYSSVLQGINDQLSGSWKTLFKFTIIVGIGYAVLYMLLRPVYILIVILTVAYILCTVGSLIVRFGLYYSSIKEMKAYIDKHGGEPV